MIRSRGIRRAQRPLHREDVVAAARDVVGTPARAAAADLRGIEGFRVDGPDGRIGTATGISARVPGAPPDTIHVATGLFAVRVVPVAAADVLQVDHDRRRVLVR